MYSQFYTNGPLNWGKYSNPELDKQLDAGRQALDVNARKAAYQKAAAIIAADLPYYVISYQGYQLFYAKALGNLEVEPARLSSQCAWGSGKKWSGPES